jgi:hypothetical protein
MEKYNFKPTTQELDFMIKLSKEIKCLNGFNGVRLFMAFLLWYQIMTSDILYSIYKYVEFMEFRNISELLTYIQMVSNDCTKAFL